MLLHRFRHSNATNFVSGQNDKDLPTARALDDHIWKLKTGRTGTAAGTAAGTAKSTPRKKTVAATKKAVTPKTPKTPKSATPKPPASSGKRKRTEMSEDEMSDVEESEPEVSKAKLTEDVGCRNSIPRSKKSPSKVYKDDSSDEEDDQETVVEANTATNEVKVEEGVANGGDVINDFFNIDGAAAAEEETNHLAGASPSKKRRVADDSDAMSDISNFSATFS